MKSVNAPSQPLSIVTNIAAWRALRCNMQNKRIGFIPTMGNLHAGHMALCQRAKEECDIVVVSIFVNPKQFNEKSDFDLYPRTLDADHALLQQYGVNYLFLPGADEIYADNYHVKITEDNISTVLEGAQRPGHFDGVLTVVMKLFNIIQAQCAYFGEKDYQQLLLIQRMVNALFLPMTIIGCDIVRDQRGLALSSRNSRLSDSEKIYAAHFHRLLKSRDSNQQVARQLNDLGFQVEYIVEKWRRRLGAVRLNGVRLIDNVRWHN